MKRRLVNQLVATTICVLLIGTVAGCKGETKSLGNQTGNSADSSLSSESNNDSTDTNIKKISIFVDETWWPYEVWEGAIPEAFEKKLGVDIEVTRAADDNQLPLMVASGEMPDLICSYRYQYLADNNVSYALDELQKKYPDIGFDVDDATRYVNTIEDGHFYTIGTGYSPSFEIEKYDEMLVEGPGFMYRKDIADKLGLEINSMEDLEAAFAKVKEEYPDMIVCSFNNIHKFGWLMQQMGLATSGYYVKDDGSLGWYLEQEEMPEYYEKINEWYRKGYIPAENFAYQSEDETKEICVGGKVFANFGYDNHADNFNNAIKVNGDDFEFKLLTNTISDKCKKYNNGSGGRGLYVTKSAKDVEAAYKTLAYAYQDEGMKLLMWGVEGEDYTVDEKGYPTFTYDFQGDNNELQPRGLKYWGWMSHNEVVTGIAEATSDSQTAEARKEMAKYVERNPVIGMIRFETDTDEANIDTKLKEMVKNQETNIFMADSEEASKEAYSTMISQAKQIGMDSLVTYGNSKYTDMNKDYQDIIEAADR